MRARTVGVFPLVVALSVITRPGECVATPDSGVSSLTLNQSSEDGRDFVIRETTIAPGGSTGWHFHDGSLVGAIKQGTLTHYSANCSVDGVYNPGDTINEPAGPEHVHLGRNLGATPVILEIIYVLPSGKPLAEDAANPGCPFS